MPNFGALLDNFATDDLKRKKWLIGPTSPLRYVWQAEPYYENAGR